MTRPGAWSPRSSSIRRPGANTYYPVHFPSGMTITAPYGSRSCVQFCAYHGTYVRNGVNVNYGVILCNAQEASEAFTGGTFTVHKEWSNSAHACVAQ